MERLTATRIPLDADCLHTPPSPTEADRDAWAREVQSLPWVATCWVGGFLGGPRAHLTTAPGYMTDTGVYRVLSPDVPLAEQVKEVWRNHGDDLDTRLRDDWEGERTVDCPTKVQLCALDLLQARACSMLQRVEDAREADPEFAMDKLYPVEWWLKLPSTSVEDAGWLWCQMLGLWVTDWADEHGYDDLTHAIAQHDNAADQDEEQYWFQSAHDHMVSALDGKLKAE